jgi:hypothetical protein
MIRLVRSRLISREVLEDALFSVYVSTAESASFENEGCAVALEQRAQAIAVRCFLAPREGDGRALAPPSSRRPFGKTPAIVLLRSPSLIGGAIERRTGRGPLPDEPKAMFSGNRLRE